MPAAAIYTRISKDDEGDTQGVERQRQDAAAYCAEHGYEDPVVFVDNDRSASSYARKDRPAFDQMLADARAGQLDVLVLYDLDRLTRVPRVGEDIIDLAAGGLSVVDGNGVYDLQSGDGRHRFRNAINNAALESDKTSKRMRRKKEQLAADGRPAGSGRAFGYELDGMTVRKAEAKLLRDAAKAVIAGASLTSVARKWNAVGVEPPQSRKGTWTATQVRAVLTNPRHAGLRAHKGEVIGPAAWPAILKPETHERLTAALAKNRRPPERQRSLLTGLVVCGVCGATMHRSRVNGAPVMRCNRAPRVAGCGKVSIKAEPLEDHAIKILMTFDTAGFAKALEGRESDYDAPLLAEIEQLEQELRDADEDRVTRAIDRAQHLRITQRIKGQRNEARAKLAQRDQRSADVLKLYAGKAGALRKAWPKLDHDKQRAILAAVIEAIEVQPTRVSAAKPAKSERHSPSALKVRAWSTPDGRNILERVDFYVLGTTDDEIARLLRAESQPKPLDRERRHRPPGR
jgi:site-specific DNA recombinase